MPDILTMPDDEFLKNINNLPGDTPPAVVVETVVEEVLPEVVPPVEEMATEPVLGEVVPPVETPDPDAVIPPVDETVVPPVEEDTTDYKALYGSIVGTEFKAGGKMIKVQTPEEARQLMQMGGGFHSAMAKIAPHRRIIETLKEHGLLDESKINELIDISKKNPEAIAALVQSAGLEPHQLIPSGDAQPYTPGNHVLPETQLQFRSSIETIREQGGTEFLTHVAETWDVTSRAEVFKDPRALHLVYEHKQDGTYDKISSEVERRKVFDPSVASLPFIHAYLAVGNDMHEKGLLAPQQEPTTPAPVVVTPTPVPVVVRPAVASQPLTPNPAAAKAAAVRSTPTPASATPNYLTMSDDEFKKNHSP